MAQEPLNRHNDAEVKTEYTHIGLTRDTPRYRSNTTFSTSLYLSVRKLQ